MLTEVAQARRGGLGMVLETSVGPSELPYETSGRRGIGEANQEASTGTLDPTCAMSVVKAGTENTAEFEQSAYYRCCAGCQHAFSWAPESHPTEDAQS